MANTTNFGWETPDDTDLVKDGAAAMRTLGNSIDSSFVDLKGGTTGQVLAKNTNTDLDFVWQTLTQSFTLLRTQSLSAVASQSINNVFSDTYQNYLITFTGFGSAANVPTFKLRAAGTDSSAGYYSAIGMTNWTSGGAATAYTNNGSAWDQRPFGHLDSNSNSVGGAAMNIFSPFQAKNTCYNAIVIDSRTSGNGAGYSSGIHTNATSYDGFTLAAGSGTLTGTIRVYGLAN